MNENTLSHEGPLTLPDDHTARRYDIFGTANFFNYVPWRASINYLMSIGLENIHAHNQLLVRQLTHALNKHNFQLISPQENAQLTNIVVFSHRDPSRNAGIIEHLKTKGIHLAFWKGKLRASPHIYNQTSDIQQLIESLNETNNK